MVSGFSVFSLLLASLFANGVFGCEVRQNITTLAPAGSQTEIIRDPAVHFGCLANGMHFVILRKAGAPGQISMRLRIATGSLNEDEGQQGLAHFVEHLAFRGSTHVPDGEMLKILQRKGVAFGPDTNAVTTQQQTVYAVDLPANDSEAVSTGLFFMREIASELSFDPNTVDAERGVILSEERLISTPTYKASIAQANFLLEGQKAVERWPIGSVEVVGRVSPSAIREFYRANYRPERATLIVVGDVDPRAVEQLIKLQFADWHDVSKRPADPDLGRVDLLAPNAKVVVEPGAPESIQLAWIRPYDSHGDTHSRRMREWREFIALRILNRRLALLVGQANSPFVASNQTFFRSAELGVLTISTVPGQWRPALEAAELCRRQVIEYGVRQDEVDREVRETRSILKGAVDAEQTLTAGELAARLLRAVDDGKAFTSPAEELVLFEDAMRGHSVPLVDRALRRVYSGQGPKIVATSATPIDGGAQVLKSALVDVEAQRVAPDTEHPKKAWPYTRFGKAGRIVDTRQINDLGVTFIRYENGVNLTVKPTSYRQGEVLVNVRVGGGFLGLPRGHEAPTWAFPTIIEGGLKDLSLTDVQAALSGKAYEQKAQVAEDAFEIRGVTRRSDLLAQLQLLAADISAPAFRPEAFERSRLIALQALEQLSSTPSGVAEMYLPQAEHGGDLRWSFPTQATLSTTPPGAVARLLSQALNDGPLEIVIVGDISVDEAVQQTSVTFGSLPIHVNWKGRLPDALPSSGSFASSLTLHHTGRTDQALAIIGWHGPDGISDVAEFRRVSLMGEILRLRIFDDLRISQGLTYTPYVLVYGSQAAPNFGYIVAQVEFKSANISSFYNSIENLTIKLKSDLISQDELNRARGPILEAIARDKKANQYWVDALAGAYRDSRKLDRVRSIDRDYRAVTIEDIRNVARRYFDDLHSWRVSITPAPKEQLPGPH
jgi:zinc protease